MDNEIFELKMERWNCANCGCVMAMPLEMNDKLRSNHATFYCYNGHANVYNKKTPIEETENKLMNEYAKNAQLEDKIKKLEEKFINRIFKPK